MSSYEIPAEGRNYCLFERRGVYDTETQFHSAVEIIIVNEGKVSATINGRQISAGKGCGIFIDGFSLHSYHESEKSDAYILLGDKKYFDNFFLSLKNKVLPETFKFNNTELIKSLYDNYLKLSSDENLKKQFFAGAVNVILSAISSDNPPIEKEPDRQSDLMCEILKYAAENIESDLSLKNLGYYFGYSEGHLSRLIHRFLNENWTQYVNRLRVKKADGLISQGKDVKISDVAFAVGFENLNSFYRAYKKEFGKNPKINQ